MLKRTVPELLADLERKVFGKIACNRECPYYYYLFPNAFCHHPKFRATIRAVRIKELTECPKS